MTFKQKLAETLISKLEIYNAQAWKCNQDDDMKGYAKYMDSMWEMKLLAQEMYGIDPVDGAVNIINKLVKFTK
jgi:hypothetical protein